MENQEEGIKKFASLLMAPLTWYQFKEHIIAKKRYQTDYQKFIEAIGEMSVKRQRILTIDMEFYRARVGPDRNIRERKSNTLLPIKPYKGKEMQIPTIDKRRPGRANARGIGVLYLASDERTATAEVRPWKGALVSVAKFNLIQDVKIVDLTGKKGDVPSLLWLELASHMDLQLLYEGLWEQIDREFAEPISPEDSEINYIPTQILAEAFQKLGAQGIVYKSAMSSTGYNLVLFEENMAKQDEGSATLTEIIDIGYTSKPYKSAIESYQENLQGALQGNSPNN